MTIAVTSMTRNLTNEELVSRFGDSDIPLIAFAMERLNSVITKTPDTTELDEAYTNISNLEDEVSNLENELSEAKDEINTLEDRVGALQATEAVGDE